MEKRIANLEADMKEIKENHLPHLALELGNVKTDVKWIKKIQWVVVSSALAGIVLGLMNLLMGK